MPNTSYEISSPRPGDTVGTTLPVSGTYSTQLDLSVAGPDQVQVRIFESDGSTLVAGPLTTTPNFTQQSGVWAVTFTALSVGDNRVIQAVLTVNGNDQSAVYVENIDVADQPLPPIVVLIGAPIP